MPSRQSWEPAATSTFYSQKSANFDASLGGPLLVLNIIFANKSGATLNVAIKDSSTQIGSVQIPAGDSREFPGYPGIRVASLNLTPSSACDCTVLSA